MEKKSFGEFIFYWKIVGIMKVSTGELLFIIDFIGQLLRFSSVVFMRYLARLEYLIIIFSLVRFSLKDYF